MNISEVIVS